MSVNNPQPLRFYPNFYQLCFSSFAKTISDNRPSSWQTFELPAVIDVISYTCTPPVLTCQNVNTGTHSKRFSNKPEKTIHELLCKEHYYMFFLPGA